MIARALISVSDKTGIAELGKELSEAGVEILSTGGTARVLRDAGVPVIDVSQYTDSPEVMDGRVKTLHPRIHGGLLMRDTEGDREELKSLGGKPIDLVVVNLYPFEQTVAKGAEHDEVIENIDIGGPSMVRSAAKNHSRVTVVTDPADYGDVLEAVSSEDGGTEPWRFVPASRRERPSPTRRPTTVRSRPTSPASTRRASGPSYPGTLTMQLQKAYDVRYGENPHQKGAFYVDRDAEVGKPRPRRPPWTSGARSSASTTSSTSTRPSSACASSSAPRRSW